MQAQAAAQIAQSIPAGVYYILAAIIMIIVIVIIYYVYEFFHGVGTFFSSTIPNTLSSIGTSISNLSYTNGAGILMTCAPGYDEIAGLCYPSCPAGTHRSGITCTQDCPSGFTDTGLLTCEKPQSYGRGSGHAASCPGGYTNTGISCYRTWPPDSQSLDAATCASNEDKVGALCYPKCNPGFYAFGCCVCSPSCPPGMTDQGIYCSKSNPPVAVGTVPNSCPTGYSKDPTGALCYPTCKTGYHMVGPVCWQNSSSGPTSGTTSGTTGSAGEYFVMTRYKKRK